MQQSNLIGRVLLMLSSQAAILWLLVHWRAAVAQHGCGILAEAMDYSSSIMISSRLTL